MTRKLFAGIGVACGLLAVGCSTSTPLAPAATTKVTTGPDNSTLKVSAPALVSPVTGNITTRQPTLVLQQASGPFATPQVSYEFQVTTLTGQVVYTRTVAGGAATGQGTVSHTVQSLLDFNTSYRWRARAVLGNEVGPFSNSGVGSAMFVTNIGLTAASSSDEFRTFFFALIEQKGVGPTASAQGLATMEADLAAVGIILEKTSSGQIRGRIYLPTGDPKNLFARAVDIGSFGGPWAWVSRGGGTVCEGLCP